MGTERFFVLYADEPVDALAARATAEAKALVAAGTDLSTVRRLPLDVRAQNSVHIVKGTR